MIYSTADGNTGRIFDVVIRNTTVIIICIFTGIVFRSSASGRPFVPRPQFEADGANGWSLGSCWDGD